MTTYNFKTSKDGVFNIHIFDIGSNTNFGYCFSPYRKKIAPNI